MPALILEPRPEPAARIVASNPFHSLVARMIYLFTRNPDGSVVATGYSDLRGAHRALETYIATAKQFGYEVEPGAISASFEQRYCARRASAVISYWLSATAA